MTWHCMAYASAVEFTLAGVTEGCMHEVHDEKAKEGTHSRVVLGSVPRHSLYGFPACSLSP